MAFGVTSAVTMLALDQPLFAGASLERVRALGEQSVTEELICRVGIATFVAWLAPLALNWSGPISKTIAIMPERFL